MCCSSVWSENMARGWLPAQQHWVTLLCCIIYIYIRRLTSCQRMMWCGSVPPPHPPTTCYHATSFKLWSPDNWAIYWPAVFTGDILTYHRRKNSVATNNMNHGCIPFRWVFSRTLLLCMLALSYGVNIIINPVLFPLWQVKMCVYSVILYDRVPECCSCS